MDGNQLIQNLFQKIQSLESQIQDLKPVNMEQNTKGREKSTFNSNNKMTNIDKNKPFLEKKYTRAKSNSTHVPQNPIKRSISKNSVNIVNKDHNPELRQLNKNNSTYTVSKKNDLKLNELYSLLIENPDLVVPEIIIYF